MVSEFALGLNNLLETSENLTGFYIGKVVDDGAKDPMGHIKVRIESLFGAENAGNNEKIEDKDLPWIQMMPSCGMYVRPQKGDFVTVVFQGSIYEGFYVGHTVSMTSKSENGGEFGGKLNTDFFLNFHNSFIRGKYNGSEFELNVNKNTTVKIDGKGNVEITNAKDLTIKTDGNAEISVAKDATVKCQNCEVKASTKALIDGGGSTVEMGASGVTIDCKNKMLTLKNNIAGSMSGFCLLPACVLTGAPHTINAVMA